MMPQQPPYFPPAPLPAYPHPSTFPSNSGPGFARPDNPPLQVGIPVSGHSANSLPPLPPYPPPGHQPPLPNASSAPAFGGNIPAPVMGQAVLPYAAPAPNLMNGMQAAAPNNELMTPGQHVSAPHAPNSYPSNTCHHSNPPAPWQGQPASSCPPSQVIYPAPAACLQPIAPGQNFIPAGPVVPNQHQHMQTSCQGFPHQDHSVRSTLSPPFAAPTGCQTNLQFCDANGTAIGVPVMGAPIYNGGTHAIPSTAFPGQQPGQPWQQACSESPSPTEPVPQSSKTFFSLTKYYRGNNPQSFPSPLPIPETQFRANAGQPLNARMIEKSQNVPLNNYLRSSTGNPCLATEQSSSSCPDRSQDPMNGARRGESQIDGACSQQESQSSSIEQARKTFSRSNQGWNDQRGNNYSKGRGRRPDGWRADHRRLRCDPCERAFSSMTYLDAHISSHVKCGEEGCTFEASGKMVKEHKVVEHGKISAPTTVVGRKALALRSVESEEEIRRWREERKINYPTAANVLRKAKEMKDRKAKGEYFDGAAQKRRQSLREVLAKQRELGVPVAEIPAHYLSERNHRWQRPNKIGWNREVEERATNDKGTVLEEETACESISQRQDLADTNDKATVLVEETACESISQRQDLADTNDKATVLVEETISESISQRQDLAATKDKMTVLVEDTVWENISQREDLAATNDTVTVLVEDKVCESNSQRQDLAGNKRSSPFTDECKEMPELSDHKHVKITPVQEEVSSEVQKLGDDGKDTELQQHLVSEQSDVNIILKRNGGRRKVSRREFSRRWRKRKRHSDFGSKSQKQPSLLSKLLERDIQRDKSHLLQCIRFIVNNSFFEGWPTAPVKFFDWVEADDLFTVDQTVIEKTNSPDLQEFSNEETAHGSFTWEEPNMDISESFEKNVIGELAFNVNDDITDSDEDGIFKYINLD